MNNIESYFFSIFLLIGARIVEIKVWDPEIGCLTVGLLKFGRCKNFRLEPLNSIILIYVFAFLDFGEIVHLLTRSCIISHMIETS